MNDPCPPARNELGIPVLGLRDFFIKTKPRLRQVDNQTMWIIQKQGRQLWLLIEHDNNARSQIVAGHPESQC